MSIIFYIIIYFVLVINLKIKNLLNIQYLQGLENCLFGFMKDQLQIDNFINFCKKNESLNGGLSNNFS